MKSNLTALKDFLYILPVSLGLGAWVSTIQGRDWLTGFLAFSFLFLLSFILLKIAYNWTNSGKILGYIIALTFLVRLVVGIGLHVTLPVYGHDDEDDRAGYVFTDAHKRDDQAWMLANSDRPILDAFSRNYSSDQYGGLLAFNALIYRYLSPDAQRPLMLILVSAFFAAMGVPFMWKAAAPVFGEKVAWAATWIFALYPESILLGASAMREPYLLTFSAFVFWGFVNFGVQGLGPAPGSELSDSKVDAYVWLGLGLLGMLLVSPAVALVTLVLLGGWIYFVNRDHQISWKAIAGTAVVFLLGLLLLSSSLNRAGEIEAASPLSLIGSWFKLAVRLNVYQIEEGSGWVQKIFDEGPTWIRLPFVAIYGISQPVLPATVIHPTKPIWNIIGFLRGVGWYALIPMLLLSFVAVVGTKHRLKTTESIEGSSRTRSLILWISLLSWTWIVLSALRGGGDLWDNPRYRTILMLWQAILAGYTWVWWRETRSPWFWRIGLMEVVFLAVFTHWYGSRIYHWPGQLPFPVMVALTLGLWGVILSLGWWLDKRRA